jgi:hypothetical protein
MAVSTSAQHQRTHPVDNLTGGGSTPRLTISSTVLSDIIVLDSLLKGQS